MHCTRRFASARISRDTFNSFGPLQILQLHSVQTLLGHPGMLQNLRRWFRVESMAVLNHYVSNCGHSHAVAITGIVQNFFGMRHTNKEVRANCISCICCGVPRVTCRTGREGPAGYSCVSRHHVRAIGSNKIRCEGA
jgi:hypothetical protein